MCLNCWEWTLGIQLIDAAFGVGSSWMSLEPTNIRHVLLSGFHGNKIKSYLKNGRKMYTSFMDFYAKIIDSKSWGEAVHPLMQWAQSCLILVL